MNLGLLGHSIFIDLHYPGRIWLGNSCTVIKKRRSWSWTGSFLYNSKDLGIHFLSHSSHTGVPSVEETALEAMTYCWVHSDRHIRISYSCRHTGNIKALGKAVVKEYNVFWNILDVINSCFGVTKKAKELQEYWGLKTDTLHKNVYQIGPTRPFSTPNVDTICIGCSSTYSKILWPKQLIEGRVYLWFTVTERSEYITLIAESMAAGRFEWHCNSSLELTSWSSHWRQRDHTMYG